jgi:pimeloyl-ACP methyl ester carboxylesterase
VLMPTRLHRAPRHPARRDLVRAVARAGSVPGVDRLVAHAAKAAVRPGRGMKLTARGNPAARDLVRHAMADVGGNPNLARSWARAARRWPQGAQRALLEELAGVDLPVLLLWADEDERHPLEEAEEALDLLPDGQLRILSGTGYLMAYDDPVGVARELAAFCR